MYTTPLSTLISSFFLNHNLYAHDTELFSHSILVTLTQVSPTFSCFATDFLRMSANLLPHCMPFSSLSFGIATLHNRQRIPFKQQSDAHPHTVRTFIHTHIPTLKSHGIILLCSIRMKLECLRHSTVSAMYTRRA